jgi:hypothetical protein
MPGRRPNGPADGTRIRALHEPEILFGGHDVVSELIDFNADKYGSLQTWKEQVS